MRLERLLPALLALAKPAGAVAQVAPPEPSASVCRGFGARFEARVETFDELSHPQRLAIYSDLCDTVLRGFKGTRLVQSDLRTAGAFEAEAEHWENRAWSRSGGLLFGSSNISLNSSSMNSSSSSNQSAGWSNLSIASNSSRSSNHSAITVLDGALSCLSRLYQSVMDKFDARPPSFIAQPSIARANGLVLLSGGDRNAALSERVVANHAAFARKHGYAHWWHRGNLARGWLPYWHKVAMLRAAFRRFPDVRAFAWVDDDIVLTNHREDGDMIERALARSNASVIVTRDPGGRVGVALNTGVLIVRNDADGLSVLDEMWRRADEEREDGLSLAHDPQSSGCLHEQQALQEMLASTAYWRARVAVLEQREEDPEADRLRGGGAVERPARLLEQHAGRGGYSRGGSARWNLNTFLRWSHFNAERAEEMRYDMDAAGSGWLLGDFPGHCSGLSPVRRALCVAALLGAVVS